MADETDEHGRRLVVRNGHHRPRTVVTAAGPVAVTAPRVNDRRVDEVTGERKRLSSKILARGCRKSPKISEVLPLFYLHGLSSGDFVPALEQFLGDGATGLWNALAEVFPAARHQRCWVHKACNVTNCLPKSAQPGATKAMQEIYNAEGRAHAEKAIEAFARTYDTKWPEVVTKITDDRDELPAFYDFPAERWVRLRTANPVEPTFSTVKLRTKVTRGAGRPAAVLAMVSKLVESAQARWRAIAGAHLVPLVRTGARFENGLLGERTETRAA